MDTEPVAGKKFGWAPKKPESGVTHSMLIAFEKDAFTFEAKYSKTDKDHIDEWNGSGAGNWKLDGKHISLQWSKDTSTQNQKILNTIGEEWTKQYHQLKLTKCGSLKTSKNEKFIERFN